MKEQPEGEPVPHHRVTLSKDGKTLLPCVTPAPNHVGTHLTWLERSHCGYVSDWGGYIGSIEFYPKGAPQDEL